MGLIGDTLNAKIWPEGMNPDSGFSDCQLEKICGPEHSSRESLPFFASPWLFFSSEMYSHGKTLRSFLRWPRILPIPVFSDHGVALQHQLYGPELENASKVHLSFSSWRVSCQDEHREIVSCVYPWVPYRRNIGLRKSRSSHGTLLFVPHSLPGHVAEPYDLKSYFTETSELNPELQPRAICLAMHDVHIGLHRELRQFGLPIISAGNSASPLFVDRFYDLIRRFSFATSPGVGTQTFICEELGVQYFLFGDCPKPPDSIMAMPGSSAGVERAISIERIFRDLPGENSAQKRRLVQSALNLNLDEEHVRLGLREVFVRQLIFLIPYIVRQLPVYLRKKGGGWIHGLRRSRLQ